MRSNIQIQPHIFTITAITKDGKESRVFGFEFSLEQAKCDVVKNYGSMDEAKYEYLVIELKERGIHTLAQEMVWFKWNHPNGKEGHWIECKRPKGERFDYALNWAF